MKFLSLFAGIGGFDLGLERAGMTCVGQVEIDPFCRAVLAKHWPGVKRMEDVREVRGDEFGDIDLICGGFPCQDISVAGKGAGIHAERSGLWWEMRRIIEAARPCWVLAENVPALRTRGSDDVLASLEELGYTCWPIVVGAWAVGAPHKRDRVWIVAHDLADTDSRGQQQRGGAMAEVLGRAGHGRPTRWPSRPGEPQHEWEAPRLANAKIGTGQRGQPRLSPRGDEGQGQPKPGVGVATDGLPRRLAGFARRSSLKALGNAVVPQVAEVIGRAIMESLPRHQATTEAGGGDWKERDA